MLKHYTQKIVRRSEENLPQNTRKYLTKILKTTKLRVCQKTRKKFITKYKKVFTKSAKASRSKVC